MQGKTSFWPKLILIVFCIYKFYSIICGYSTTASASAFKAEDEGSIPFTRSILNKCSRFKIYAELIICWITEYFANAEEVWVVAYLIAIQKA